MLQLPPEPAATDVAEARGPVSGSARTARTTATAATHQPTASAPSSSGPPPQGNSIDTRAATMTNPIPAVSSAAPADSASSSATPAATRVASSTPKGTSTTNVRKKMSVSAS
ncbi:MAG: hypothetical protein R2695_13805 [Acidimicrobiales bacterium]